MDDYGAVKFQLLIILDRKIIKKREATTMVLVQWSHLFKEYATSKELEDLSSQFPEFNTNSWGQESPRGSIVIGQPTQQVR